MFIDGSKVSNISSLLVILNFLPIKGEKIMLVMNYNPFGLSYLKIIIYSQRKPLEKCTSSHYSSNIISSLKSSFLNVSFALEDWIDWERSFKSPPFNLKKKNFMIFQCGNALLKLIIEKRGSLTTTYGNLGIHFHQRFG